MPRGYHQTKILWTTQKRLRWENSPHALVCWAGTDYETTPSSKPQNLFSADQDVEKVTHPSAWKVKNEKILKEGMLNKRCTGKTVYWAQRHVVLSGESLLLANEQGGEIRGMIPRYKSALEYPTVVAIKIPVTDV